MIELPNTPDSVLGAIVEFSNAPASSEKQFCFPAISDNHSVISMSMSTAPIIEHDAPIVLFVGIGSRPDKVAGAIIKVLSKDQDAPVVSIEATGQTAIHIALNSICMARCARHAVMR